MTRIYSKARINRSIDDVFNYVTNPFNWPKWHPSSLAVEGCADRSLTVGEQVREEYLVAGRQGSVIWTVIESKPPHGWAIEGKVGNEGGGTISYLLSEGADGVVFEREFVYQMARPVLRFLDWLIFRRRIQAESDTATRQLKSVLEANEGNYTVRKKNVIRIEPTAI